MRNILLAVSGLSPQVITEALYALLHEGRQVHALHVITTRRGKDRLLSGFFDPDCRRIDSLLADFGLSPASLDFGVHNIHSLKNASGVELEDIVTPEDNEILLQTCLELTFHFAGDDDTALWFLVAGGRKTMTSCLTLAAQLYGRPRDRIFHVLVSPEFENCPSFWFPPKKSVMISLLDDKGQPFLKETRYAEVQLVTIPFVSIRPLLAGDMLDQPRPPADLLQSLIRDTPKMLTIKLAEGKIVYNGMELDMHPARLALYAFFAEQKKKCTGKKSCSGCYDCFLDAASVISGTGISIMYGRIPGGRLLAEMSDTGIGSLSKENFNSYKSKIRTDLLRVFGQAHAAELEITSHGDRPDTRYGIRLDRRQIRLEW
ncbi:MAG: CRISPR-associated protein [Desulfobulbaceae bacterium DB1]|nr:MAG: CRISPR-associated protein [Desulfobulbaceae bacterium DB1]